jgi:hypothetical protein
MVMILFALLATNHYNILRVRNLRLMFSVLLILSLFYTTSLFTLYLYHYEGDSHIWNKWIMSILYVGTLTLFALCNMEILVLFSPIAPFWTRKRVQKLQIAEGCLHLVLNLPCYVYPAFMFSQNSFWKSFFQTWFYMGVVGHFAMVACFCTCEWIYLFIKSYQHLRSQENQDIKIRVAGLIRFGLLYGFLVFVDWYGLSFYATPGDIFYRTVGHGILNYRVLILVVIFYELKSFTLTQNQLFGYKPEKTIVEIGPIPTVQFRISREPISRTTRSYAARNSYSSS